LAETVAIRASQRSGVRVFAFDDGSDCRTAFAVAIKMHGETVDRTTRVCGANKRKKFQLIEAVALTHGLATPAKLGDFADHTVGACQ
jgi:hypothetical protein